MEIDKQIGGWLNGFQPALLIIAANRLGIFDRLAGKPVTAKQVADGLKLSLKGSERLLNALAGLGIVTKEKDQFHMSLAWRKYLTKAGDHSMQQWIGLMSDLIPVWTQLPDFIRSGNPITSIMEMLGSDPERMRAFINAMHDKGLKATSMLARELPVGDATRMLDVGGGPGTYSLEWAKLHKNLKATIFDIAPVLEVARDYIKRYGLEDRVDTKPGDFNTDDLGSGYDLVLLANILHMYPPEAGKKLVAKAVKALVPGGRIIIHGFCTDNDRTSPIEDSLFSLTMGMMTEGGNAHPIKEKIGWLKEAMTEDIRHFRIDAVPTGVLSATRRVH